LALLDEDDFASDSALAAASQQSIYRNVGHYGWIPVGETWSYASSTTVTISGDKTDKYSKGMKVKLTQTSVKYFYITGVSYASPNTTLTLTAGTDYTVANAAITSPFYSMVANPAGFQHLYSWTPIFAGFSSDPTNVDAKFIINGRLCTANLSMGAGTSNANNFLISAPLTAVGFHWSGNMAFYVNGGSSNFGGGYVTIYNGESNFRISTTSGQSSWSNSGDKYARFQMFFEF
jgi:hypothetical protein